MQSTGADLATEGVQRQLTIARNALAALDESATLAHFAEAERLEPRDGLKGEAVVELHGVDIFRRVIRALPQICAGGIASHPFGLVPTVPLDDTRHRGNANRCACHF